MSSRLDLNKLNLGISIRSVGTVSLSTFIGIILNHIRNIRNHEGNNQVPRSTLYNAILNSPKWFRKAGNTREENDKNSEQLNNWRRM